MEKRIYIRVPEQLLKDFDAACEANYTTKSEVLRRAMLEYVRGNKKEDIRMKLERINGTLVPVRYHRYSQHPAPPDITGYVLADDLLPISDQYIDYEADEPALKAGYTQVTAEDGEVYIVRQADIYTRVVPHDGIAGGLAVPTPGGGLSALAGKPTHEDSEGNLYVRNYW